MRAFASLPAKDIARCHNVAHPLASLFKNGALPLAEVFNSPIWQKPFEKLEGDVYRAGVARRLPKARALNPITDIHIVNSGVVLGSFPVISGSKTKCVCDISVKFPVCRCGFYQPLNQVDHGVSFWITIDKGPSSPVVFACLTAFADASNDDHDAERE